MKRTLYEINTAIAEWEPVVDEETGEILNIDELDALEIARDEKIESIALKIKMYNAEAKMGEEEKKDAVKTLDRYIRGKEKQRDSLKRYLQSQLQGQKFKTPRCSISYHKSNQVILADEFDDWAKENAPELLTVKTTYTPSKTAIKEAMLEGKNVQYATLIENTNLILK